MKKMKIIGLTGGTGSGKTTVASLLVQITNAYIIDADHIGHEQIKKGKPAYNKVIEFFGGEIVDQSGEINRKKLGGIVFSDPSKLQKLNECTHPFIRQEIENQIQQIREEGQYEYIVVDAALLVEIGFHEMVDEVWGVYAHIEQRMQRIMKRDQLDAVQAKQRLDKQMSWDKLRKYVDRVIDTTGGIEHIRQQLMHILGDERT
jgi:dephospho-CoA kinase